MEHCCEEMAQEVKDGNILTTELPGTSIVWYYGMDKPHFEPDGYDIMDDMTGNYALKFCPFCGKKLEVAP